MQQNTGAGNNPSPGLADPSAGPDERPALLRTWLARTLGSTEFTMARASEDASFRSYFRIRTGSDSFVAMDAPTDKEDCGAYVNIAGVLRRAGVNVPEVLSADLEQGFLLLSDLGDRHYLDGLTEENADRLYGDAMGALLSMQACVDGAPLAAYDEAILRSEMSLFTEWFLHTHLGLSLWDRQHAVLAECFDFLCRSAAEQPRVFVHRDYHSRNLMVHGRQNPGILDFQGAVYGPVSYDLVSLLRDVYIQWPVPRVRAWAQGYQDLAVQHGIIEKLDADLWLRWFDLMGVQRHIKVAGIFARLYHRDGKSNYLRDIPFTLNYLTAVCTNYPELHGLQALLEELRVRERLEIRNAQAFADSTA